ncbi:hypothetical protein AAC691_16610 [Nguyenibacter vanlangensis]|uniref:DUF47 family protein n=2 Tax=Nguyenibacter vanlangensis TaxID=1216886 RepID=A0ABZ3D294_9PROT
MTIQKQEAVAALAQPALLLPNLLAEALAANGRIKFALSWLQAAEASAGRDDRQPFAGLTAERTLAGLDHAVLYDPPALLERTQAGLRVPQAGAVIAALLDDLSRMRRAAEAGAAAGLLDQAAADGLGMREHAQRAAIRVADDVLPPGLVSQLCRVPAEGADSLHRLVMDLHRAINDIAAGLAETDIAGARAYRLDDRDRQRVAAFMRGLNRTAPLKFNHPGLATNAMRDGPRLIIQNDLGTTDAHVLIVQIEGRDEAPRLSVLHSDIHRQRLEFFQNRLPALTWTQSSRHLPGSEQGQFTLATGILQAADLPALDAALETLGASLVFLIDWNKARKSLRHFVSGPAAVALLHWAADHEYGHRAYLEAGGETMIGDLLDTVSQLTGGSYGTMQRALGQDGTMAFLREALRTSSEALRNGQSPPAIRDMLQAELMTRVASMADRILDDAIDHAALILDLGSLVHAALLGNVPDLLAAAARAQRWEALADRQVGHICGLCRDDKSRPWRAIASHADDAADQFEDAAFRLQFLPADLPADIRATLLQLAAQAVMAAKDYVRLLCALRSLHQGMPRREMRLLIGLFDRLHAHEHATDAAERDVFARLMHADLDARTVTLATAIAGALESVADALLNAGRLLSDHAVGEWFAP